MIENKHAVCLYSGGTDSTCAVCLKVNEFEKIHLLSYKRFGIFKINNIETNIKKLRNMFGEEKFVTQVIDIDKIFKLVSYDNYFYNLKKFGLFNLATCGLCKFAMHVRTILYCLCNDIKYVFDGANKYSGNGVAMDQISEFIDVIASLYKRFDIYYSAPVYNIIAYDTISMEKNLNFVKDNIDKNIVTTGSILKQFNFFDKDNIKGTEENKKIQPKCRQSFLASFALPQYYQRREGIEKYKTRIKEFFNSKRADIIPYIEEFIKNKQNSKLAEYIKP